MYPFRKLSVWEKAHSLTLRVYELTDGPLSRRFPALTSQLRRAIAAVPANLAEGAGRSTDPQFNRYIETALASAYEADYHLLLARDLGALASRDYAFLEAQLAEVKQMMIGLRKRVLERIAQNGKRGGRKASPLLPTTYHP